MKLFGVILLAGYFLTREQDDLPPGKDALRALVRSTAVYWLCAGLATLLGGLLGRSSSAELQPVAILFAAILPVIIFKGRPICFIAGAATAFCVLRFMPEVSRVVTTLFCAEVAALSVAFFYEGMWRRALRLQSFSADQKSVGRLLLLFALSVLLALVCQRIF